MADKSSDGHATPAHARLSQTLGALGPGGTAAIGYEDYERLFGAQPTEDELEGQRAAGSFAAKHGCEHKVDAAQKRVVFWKRG